MNVAQLSIRQIADVLGGDVIAGNRVLCPGPGHSRRDRSLAVTFLDGRFSVKSFAGDDWRDCRDHVKGMLGLSDDRPVPFKAVPQVDPDRLRRQKTAADIWARAKPITSTLAETYLAFRGLSYSGDALRFYPGARAMIALITDAITGEPIGIHRTFLDRDGNRTDKKMLGAAAGGVVRLSPDDEVTTSIGIAEGIETALAAPFRPIWASLSAGGMKSFPVLPGVTSLSIFADQDRAGLEAANACGKRWHEAGREVTMVAPVVGDFADRREAA